jgi:hypothetical protein
VQSKQLQETKKIAKKGFAISSKSYMGEN